MLTLLLVCSFSPRVHSIPRGPLSLKSQNFDEIVVFSAGFENSSVRGAHCTFEITLSGTITLTLLLVCSFSPKVQKYLLGTPEYRKSDRLRSTICCKQQCYAFVRQIAQSLDMSAALDFRKCKRLLLSSLAVSPKGFTPQAARHRRAEPPKRKRTR